VALVDAVMTPGASGVPHSLFVLISFGLTTFDLDLNQALIHDELAHLPLH
jgi:hypothetical protein